jgi:hypothetical protein
MRVFRTRACAAFLFINLIWSGSAAAQGWTLPQLMPGGAGKVYDIIGISPGMTCDAAKPIFLRQFPGRTNPYYNVSDRSTTVRAKISGEYVEWQARWLHALIFERDHTEEFSVICSTKEALDQVVSVSRRWLFQADDSQPPVDQVRRQLEEKYGAFGSTFARPDNSIAVFGTFFGQKGRLSGPDDACGRFFFNTADGAIAQFLNALDPLRCSFALYAALDLKSGDASRVGQMKVTIWDYARFAKLVQFSGMVKEEVSKGKGPPVIPRM